MHRTIVALAAATCAFETVRVSRLVPRWDRDRCLGTVRERVGPRGIEVEVVGDADDEPWRFLLPGTATSSLGGTVWPSSAAAAVLARTLRAAIAGKRVLELGSGLGLAGLACAAAGADRALLTDSAPELVEARDLPRGVEASLLDWADERTYATAFRADVVIGADVAYYAPVVAPLEAALRAHCGPGAAAIVVGERKREAMHLLRAALPDAATLDFDLEVAVDVVADPSDPAPPPPAAPPTTVGIGVLVYAPEPAARDALLDVARREGAAPPAP